MLFQRFSKRLSLDGLKASGWMLTLLFFICIPFKPLYNISLLLLIVTGVLLCLINFMGTIQNRRVQLFMTLFMCIYLPMIIALPDAVNFDESFRKTSSFFIYIFVGVVTIHVLGSQKSRQYFLLALGLLLSFWTLDALVQYLSGSSLLGYPYTNGRLTGIFYPKYRMGLIMAMLAPLYFEFLRTSIPRFNFSWVLAVPYSIVILLGGSRTSWFMLLLSAFLYFVYYLRAGYYRHISIKPIITGICALLLVLIAVNVIKPTAYSYARSFVERRITLITDYLHGKSSDTNALEQRIEIWESALRITSVHWVNGIGVRGFRYIDHEKYIDNKDPLINETTRLSTHPHQISLEILVETGIIGLLGFIMFWWILINRTLLETRHRESLYAWPWVMPVIVAMFPLNMHKAFYGHFSSMVIWVLLAVAIAVYPADSPESAQHL
jgi:O-antigen ligase